MRVGKAGEMWNGVMNETMSITLNISFLCIGKACQRQGKRHGI